MDLERLKLTTDRIPIIIGDNVDPAKLLPPISPLVSPPVFALELFEPPDLCPDGGQRLILQDHHEVPVVSAAQLDDRSIGIKPVQQEQDWQVRKALLESLRQSMEGPLFTVLLVSLAVPLFGDQHLAEQRNDHAVLKGQV